MNITCSKYIKGQKLFGLENAKKDLAADIEKNGEGLRECHSSSWSFIKGVCDFDGVEKSNVSSGIYDE